MILKAKMRRSVAFPLRAGAKKAGQRLLEAFGRLRSRCGPRRPVRWTWRTSTAARPRHFPSQKALKERSTHTDLHISSPLPRSLCSIFYLTLLIYTTYSYDSIYCTYRYDIYILPLKIGLYIYSTYRYDDTSTIPICICIHLQHSLSSYRASHEGDVGILQWRDVRQGH